VKLNPS
jgi:serine/threonine protein kinase